MTNTHFAKLPDRAVLKIGGPEKRDFLQGLITNDMEKLAADNAIYAALLTPQGKIIADFFLVERGDDFLLDCDAQIAPALLKRLTMYKLRADVTIETLGDEHVAVLFGADAATTSGLVGTPGATIQNGDATLFVDPRHADLGARLIALDLDAALASIGAETSDVSPEAYKAHRIGLGVAEGTGELGTENMFALEANMAELNGVDFKKGCYVGQEVTARMKHKTTLRKRIVPLSSDNPLPDGDATVSAGDRTIGDLCATSGTAALALLRLDRLEEAQASGDAPQVGDLAVTPTNPPWLEIV